MIQANIPTFKAFLILTLGISAITAGCRSQTTEPLRANTNHPLSLAVVTRVYTVKSGKSSVIYVSRSGHSEAQPLLPKQDRWESDPVLSPSGNLVAYTLADNSEAQSSVWVAHVDGTDARRISAPDEDAILPAFVPGDKALLYVKSGFNGHYSPIARSRRHEFDIVKVAIDPSAPASDPIQLTHQAFFDLRSLSVSSDGEHFLLSTSAYPIGSLIEEFEIANPLAIHEIFQPHVPNEPQLGAEFGIATYTSDAMNIIFAAATQDSDGAYNYNIYRMSKVTGSELVKLADNIGGIDAMVLTTDGVIHFSASGKTFALNPNTRVVTAE